MAQTILVVDDDPVQRRLLETAITRSGMTVVTAPGGQPALDLINGVRGEQITLMLLDLVMPDMGGIEVLSKLRSTNSDLPVIVLTVRAGEAEKVRVLDAGANDYVTKPFGVQELMARIRALLRAHAAPAGAAPLFDDGVLRVDLARREVTLNAEPVALSRKEYALLALLVRNAGRVVTQPQLLREIWGPTHQHDTHYLRVLVGKLRQRLGDDPIAPRWIATEPGVGLRFLARDPA